MQNRNSRFIYFEFESVKIVMFAVKQNSQIQ